MLLGLSMKTIKIVKIVDKFGKLHKYAATYENFKITDADAENIKKIVQGTYKGE